jgi:hypothetical protein
VATVWVLGLACPQGARAQQGGSSSSSEGEVSIDEQLDQLEQEVSSQEQGGGGDESKGEGGGFIQTLNPELSFILSAGIAWTSVDDDDDGDDVANDLGFQGGPDPKKFGFFLQGLELNVGAAVDPYFAFDANIVFRQQRLVVEEAYGTTMSLPAKLQLRFGIFRTRFGRLNKFHQHRWPFTTVPMVNAKFFGPRGLRGFGVEVSQILPLPWYAEWVLTAQSLPGVRQGRSFLRNGAFIEDFLDFTLLGRFKQFFELSPNWSLQWGLNYAVGRNDSAENASSGLRTDIATTDLYLKWKSSSTGGRSEFGWQSEVMYRRRDVPEGDLEDVGLYSFVYFAPNRTWQLGARYEYTSEAEGPVQDYLDPIWIHGRHRVTGNVTYRPSEFSEFRVEYMASELPSDFSEKVVHMALLRAELVTGAHGSHAF